MSAAMSLSLANLDGGILSAVCLEMLTAPLCPLKGPRCFITWIKKGVLFYLKSE